MKSYLQLRHTAQRLWPSLALQKQWLRAVQRTRSTKQGWILDGTVVRRKP